MCAEVAPISASFAASPLDNTCGASGGAIDTPPGGASALFVDPALSAPDAPISWLDTAGAAVLDARSSLAAPRVLPDIVLTQLPSVTHVVLGPADTEQLLIRTSDCAVTLRLHGAHAADGPVRLTFQVPGLSRAQGLGTLLAELPDLLAATPRRSKRSRRQFLLRDALIVLDGRGAGASYREIACVIYGTERARTAWNSLSRSLKDRLHRAFNIGKALRDGGYRTLIP